MPARISITFDDGLASVYSFALPEMERFGVTGTVFVISDLIGTQYKGHPVMTKRMLVDLCSQGWEVGSHSRTHTRLTDLSEQRLNEELELSRKCLESVTGRSVTSLAYPYGEFDSRVESIASRHYLCARVTSSYPPLRLNPILPRDRMGLRAMGECEPAFTLPVHLYYNHLPRALTETLRRGIFKRTRTALNTKETKTALNAKIVKRWIRRMRDGGWLILYFHNISPDGTSTAYSIALREFRQIVNVIAACDQEVITLGAAFQRGLN